MLYNKFYSELGKLLYAVADVDGDITEKEKAKLKELVRKQLVPAEMHTDSYGTDAAYYAEFEFDILEESKADPQAAFDSFINFINNHKHDIDESMLKMARKSARSIANSFRNINEKEHDMLNNLSHTIHKLLEEKRK